MMTDEQIARLEAKGARRWTKGGHDRLYVDATALGLECQYKRDHEPCLGTWRGREVSNADCRRIYFSKVWVDVKDGTLHVSSEYRPSIGDPSVEDSARELLDSAMAEPEPEPAEPEREGGRDSSDFLDELTAGVAAIAGECGPVADELMSALDECVSRWAEIIEERGRYGDGADPERDYAPSYWLHLGYVSCFADSVADNLDAFGLPHMDNGAVFCALDRAVALRESGRLAAYLGGRGLGGYGIE